MVLPVIEVRDLVKRYRRAPTNAVDGVSFDVPEGQLFCLLGPNGAGKTTTVSILTTTLAITAGAVRIAGHDLATEEAQVRRAVGVVFQGASLDLNLTAEENVRVHAVLYGLYPWRPLFRLMFAPIPPTGRRGGERARGRRRTRAPGAGAVRRHPPEAGDRPGAHAPPPGAVPGRAHGRAGPRKPPQSLVLPHRRRASATAPLSCSPPTTWRKQNRPRAYALSSTAGSWSSAAPRPSNGATRNRPPPRRSRSSRPGRRLSPAAAGRGPVRPALLGPPTGEEPAQGPGPVIGPGPAGTDSGPTDLPPQRRCVPGHELSALAAIAQRDVTKLARTGSGWW